MRLVRFLLVSSLVFLAGCQSIPAPKGFGCVALPHKGRMVCFDLEKDFDVNTGEPKPNAQPTFFELKDLSTINKWVIFSPNSFASLKGFALKHKDRCEKLAGGR